MRLAIIGAMPQEIELLLQDIEAGSDMRVSGRMYHKGTLYGSEVIVVCCGPGKVSSSTTTTTLIESFGVDAVMMVGLAGAASQELQIGDIVVASELVQHDLMEARRFFEQLDVPMLAVTRIKTDERLTEAGVQASREFVHNGLISEVGPETLRQFGVKFPKVVTGLVASADKFVASADDSNRIRGLLPDVKCVEMEGAAVGQICEERGIPVGVIRTIADRADHSAEVDFTGFTRLVAGHYTRGVLRLLLGMLPRKP